MIPIENPGILQLVHLRSLENSCMFALCAPEEIKDPRILQSVHLISLRKSMDFEVCAPETTRKRSGFAICALKLREVRN